MIIDYLEFAETIARKAGIMLRNKISERHKITYKGEINLVTDADHASERFLIRTIRKQFPHHDILSEESLGINHGSIFRWIIDPLDGTTNYAHRYPVFCVSLALEVESEIIYGVIYNPMLDEMFTATKQRGAFLNGRKLAVSKTDNLSRSLLATGFPYDIRTSEDNNIRHFITMAKKAQAIRRAGSAALDIAYVAAGRFDGFWELKLMPWDTAAGLLLVNEAGGTVTDLFGHTYTLSSPHIVASNGILHHDLIQTLSAASTE